MLAPTGMTRLFHKDGERGVQWRPPDQAWVIPCPPWLPPVSRTSPRIAAGRSEEHTSEVQSLMRISYAVFCLKKKKQKCKKTRSTRHLKQISASTSSPTHKNIYRYTGIDNYETQPTVLTSS